MQVSRRLLSSLVIVTALANVPAVTEAQAPRRPVSVGLGLGATLPISDFASDTKTGWHGTGFLQYEPERNVWGVRGEVGYHRSGYTDEFLGAVGAEPDDDLSNSILHAGATALLLGNKRDKGLTPYLLGGLGYYRLTVSVAQGTAVQSESANGFGFSGGAGVRLGRNTGAYLEARFHSFSITPEGGEKSTYQMIPVTFGIRF